jgi:phosphopantothenoylcysteine decarboxylase / phosphopantothenate---cysteine ligase
MLSSKNITLIVGGSIAAYKSAELVRLMVKDGANVNVVMSSSAREFISPLTMQTLSGNPVLTNLFDIVEEEKIGHIKVADSADVVVVAPATANIIAKAACGIADDVCGAVLLATKAPVIFAPAMNVNMWENEITKKNVEILKTLGKRFIEPDSGELACGWMGQGRMVEPERILNSVVNLFMEKDLSDIDVIVTAGPTQESIDPIRFLSNKSSAKMGFALAENAYNRGANVFLVSGPTSLTARSGISVNYVNTCSEMRDAIKNILYNENFYNNRPKILFMSAAVSDHRPEKISSSKLKFNKNESYSMTLIANIDILSELGESRAREDVLSKLTLVGFCLESGNEAELIESAREKLQAKKVDLIVANLSKDALGKDTNRVWLVSHDNVQEIEFDNKSVIANKIITATMRYIEKKHG